MDNFKRELAAGMEWFRGLEPHQQDIVLDYTLAMVREGFPGPVAFVGTVRFIQAELLKMAPDTGSVN